MKNSEDVLANEGDRMLQVKCLVKVVVVVAVVSAEDVAVGVVVEDAAALPDKVVEELSRP